jgi:hypothetical protein
MPWDLLAAEQRWFKKPIVWAAVAAAVCGLLLLLPRAQARFVRWSERRGVARAVESYRHGDFKQAVIDARGVLGKNPRNREATRIIAKSLEAMQSPQALAWRRELDVLQVGDAENLLGLAEACLKARDFAGADRALKKVKSEDQTTARFHLLAGRVARTFRDYASAEAHGLEAVRLEPENAECRVELAAVQLDSHAPETRAAARDVLEKISVDSAQRLPALRALLADATSRGERSRMRQFAEALAADPAAKFTDKIVRLGILRAARDPQASSYLAELQALAVSDVENVYRLMTWMNENNLALAVLDWEGKLGPEMTSRPAVCAALAESYSRASDWEGLRKRVEHASWPDTEFLRLAFLSRALEHLDDQTAADAAWNNALAAAQARPEWLEMLGKATKSWGWKRRAEETLWKLAGSNRCPRWAADFLWSAALARGDSAKLYEAGKLLVKLDPTDIAPRNNYIYLSLLLGQTADSPQEMAEALYRQEPHEPFVASTYGFSLFLQGRAAEAVAIMDGFPAEKLRDPQVALHCAIFLAAAGEAERAMDSFAQAAGATQLPEEKALVSFLSPASRARTLELRGDSAGAAAAWK